MPKGIWIRDGSRAIPADERSMEFLQSIKDGVPFMATTNTARNSKQNSLWWILCGLVGDALDKTDRQMSDNALVTLGHAETEVTPDGTVYVRPKSIAFESLPQEEFNGIFKAAVNLFARWLGNAPSEVMAAFNAKVGDRRYSEMRR